MNAIATSWPALQTHNRSVCSDWRKFEDYGWLGDGLLVAIKWPVRDGQRRLAMTGLGSLSLGECPCKV